MSKISNSIHRLLRSAAPLVALAVFCTLLVSGCGGKGRQLPAEEPPHLTTAQKDALRNIGQWELLTIDLEELIDSTRSHTLWPDEHIIRIYRGTARLGTDLTFARPDWIQEEAFTVTLTVPAIRLLNPEIIDKSRTTVFLQDGELNAEIREPMFHKAHRLMQRRLRNLDAYRRAEEIGRTKLTTALQAAGFKTVIVNYE
ncbi:MAG: DUF4230 domain-containing protein [Bacteroidaceae bacterium]|nr:DUF4230 domain-containing protein [Bacteroidaceae bacterium]